MADRSGYIGRAPSDSSVTISRQTNTAAGSESSFVFNSGYEVGLLDVYLNGSKLINATDYTATDGQNITLTTAATAGDVLEFVAYKAFNIANPVNDTNTLAVTGALTADSASITNNLSVGGDLSVTGAMSGNGVNLTGIVTSLTAGSNISLSGSTGNVTITGVANTANINASTLNVTGLSTFRNTVLLNGDTRLNFYSSTSQEGQIYATDEYLYINSSADNGVYVQTDGFLELKAAGNSNKYVECNSHPNHNGEVSLFYNNNNKLETTNTGVTVTGILDATTVTGVVTATNSVTINGSGATKLELQQSGTPKAKFEFDGNHVNLGNLDSNGDTVFLAGNAERARFDSTGELLIGHDTTQSNIKFKNNAVNAYVQNFSSGSSYSGPSIISYSAGDYNPVLTLGISNSNTKGTNTLVGSNWDLGMINFVGNDGTSFQSAAVIEGRVHGTAASGDMPGMLSFSVSNSGSVVPTERMRISKNGEQQHFGTLATNINIANTASAGETYEFLYCQHSSTNLANGTNSFRVFTNGDVENTNGDYGNISDAKLKENIVDAPSQWDDIKAVKFRKFNFKAETGHQTHTQLGVIAQELEQTSPGLVSDRVDKGSDGKPLGTTTKSVKSSILTMKALVALQEAMERIEALEAEVAALKGS